MQDGLALLTAKQHLWILIWNVLALGQVWHAVYRMPRICNLTLKLPQSQISELSKWQFDRKAVWLLMLQHTVHVEWHMNVHFTIHTATPYMFIHVGRQHLRIHVITLTLTDTTSTTCIPSVFTKATYTPVHVIASCPLIHTSSLARLTSLMLKTILQTPSTTMHYLDIFMLAVTTNQLWPCKVHTADQSFSRFMVSWSSLIHMIATIHVLARELLHVHSTIALFVLNVISNIRVMSYEQGLVPACS